MIAFNRLHTGYAGNNIEIIGGTAQELQSFIKTIINQNKTYGNQFDGSIFNSNRVQQRALQNMIDRWNRNHA